LLRNRNAIGACLVIERLATRVGNLKLALQQFERGARLIAQARAIFRRILDRRRRRLASVGAGAGAGGVTWVVMSLSTRMRSVLLVPVGGGVSA
jgi:hypothetical protein